LILIVAIFAIIVLVAGNFCCSMCRNCSLLCL
jgi:hypothetical protein